MRRLIIVLAVTAASGTASACDDHKIWEPIVVDPYGTEAQASSARDREDEALSAQSRASFDAEMDAIEQRRILNNIEIDLRTANTLRMRDVR